jgi:acyl transferase domain-containing protein
MSSVEDSTHTGREIAIIGMACRAPGVSNTASLWQLSTSGMESISSYTREELEKAGISPELLDDPNYVKKIGHFENKNLFDAAFFGYSVGQAKVLDPQFALFHECVWEAMEQAGVHSGRVGVYAGGADSTDWSAKVKHDFGSPAETFFLGTMCGQNFLSTRISFDFNLQGPAQNVQTACSTSLVAVHEACQSLLTQQCDIALAGGVAMGPKDKRGYLYQEGMNTSPDGACYPFEARSNGTVASEGAGVVVLKRLTEATKTTTISSQSLEARQLTMTENVNSYSPNRA